jgi:putative transposase
VKTFFIEPSSPWENGYVESFFVLLRDELLEREEFDTLLETNGALRAVAAAHQHDSATQCLGLSPPGPSRRGSPVRSHGVRLSKRTGLVYWRAKS